MKNREYLYREILNMLRGLNCNFDYHQLHGFVTNTTHSYDEFCLGGTYGMGFKLKKDREHFYFTQYIECETPECRKWLDQQNAYLDKFCAINS